MQIKSLRIKSYRSWQLDDRQYSDTAKYRHKKLVYYWKLRKEGCSEPVALEVVEVSRATLFRWQSAFRQHGMAGLEPGSTAPQHKRQPSWSKAVEQQVLRLRKKFPLWGKATITTLLNRDQKLNVSESTVGRILKKLLKVRKIKPVAFYYGQTKQKKRRCFNRHANRWKKTMKAKQPGQLLQIDHMSVSVGPGFGVKHFKATCPVTKITVFQAYHNASSKTAAQFLAYLQKLFPFSIQSIQVDGGSEFMKDFEQACCEAGIPLYVLPPKSPELNGCVERCNRTIRYEFYQLYDGLFDLYRLREALKNYMAIYNEYRPHQALNQLTPMAYYQQYLMEAA